VGAVDDDVAEVGLPVVDVDAPVAGAAGRGTPLVVTT
jgi:hypothetical protein